jgi:hypothetical protein
MAKDRRPADTDAQDAETEGQTPEIANPSQDRTAPPATQPASMRPVIQPEKPAPKLATLLSDTPVSLPNDISMFKAMPEAQAQEMIRVVPCQVIQDLNGCIGLKHQYRLRQGQQVALPKWFALSHPKAIVIRG